MGGGAGVGTSVGTGVGVGTIYGLEGRRDMRIDPERPEGVVEVEDDEGREWQGVGECGWY